MPSFTSVATSTFTGADEATLSEGGAWGTVSGQAVYTRTGNTAAPGGFGSDAAARHTNAGFVAGQYSRANLTTVGTTANTGIGLALLCSATLNTLYRFYINHAASNNASLDRFVNGVWSGTLDTWTQTFSNGDQFTFAVSNEVLYIYNSALTLVRTKGDVGGGVATTGKPGLAFSSTTSAGTFLDNWEGGTFTIGQTINATTSGSLVIAGQSVVLRPGSTTYLRYRR